MLQKNTPAKIKSISLKNRITAKFIEFFNQTYLVQIRVDSCPKTKSPAWDVPSALNTPLDKFVASLKHDREPGTCYNYVSMDTQVLGMIITEATGTNLSEYMEEKLWKPMGMESDAYWLIDSAGMWSLPSED
jgi:hypothetical protein